MTTSSKSAFISGPISPPPDYFATHYTPPILTAASRGDNFILGPASGIDTLALNFLLTTANVPAYKITVYLAEFENKAFRSRFAAFEAAGGNIKVVGVTTGERDAAMTEESDYDILRYMTQEEASKLYGNVYWPRISNTEKNERRRKGLPLHGSAEEAAVVKTEGGWLKRVRERFEGK
ncbi:hypothetical protein FN846DRAFT_906227 [Sphaerosporella brunnea]|uniref:Uncharacterized protein n=1 Tax=Sphaerosporella brunnea TaxID=1250544 RepID=A0A5J5EYY0_9PEZI|nr:hypothetical protein FN846DRAFT_906227 [Sphaerosporella brunnea]